MDFAPIPGPRGFPLIGNLLDLRDEEAPLRALERLADTYGPIYQIRLAGGNQIIVSSAEMMKEVMDEKRYMKTAVPGLHEDGKPDGLIIAGTLDPDWAAGHRILSPAFGPIKIENMFDGMKDIAHQLVLKWARFGPDEEIAITEDFSNLTLDTIALCTMDFRFNSFYRDGAHPYVAAMNNVLGGAGAKAANIPIISTGLRYLGAVDNNSPTPGQVNESLAFMQKIGQEIIENRRNSPIKKDDFLDTLLFGKDLKTGEVMRDELIRAQMQTFLIAGHETTSGLLSFAVIFLLQNPHALQKAQQEVDELVGSSGITVQHIRALKYISAVLHETLRLVPTAPVISKIPHPHSKDPITTLGGKYKIESTSRVRLLLSRCMQDPSVFGEDAREFKPERMIPELNPNHHQEERYWRPFSEGSRSCIGRSFSLQEAVLALALVLQNFDLRLTDPMYQTRIKQTVTIKPVGLKVKAQLRNGLTPVELEKRLQSKKDVTEAKPSKVVAVEQNCAVDGERKRAPLTILFGSNQGTCQALAQRLASEALALGFDAEVTDLDAAAGRLSKEHPTVICVASYEGEPPDNALQFVQNLEALEGSELSGVKYAVFGCGNRDWYATFHRIPKYVNDTMEKRGAQRIAEVGLSDVAKGNPMADFETWLDRVLLPELKKLSPRAGDNSRDESLPDAEAVVSTGERVATLHQELQVGVVKNVQLLTSPGEPVKRHMEVELPQGSTYECGDYLAILPQSPEANVRAVMAHFKLPTDATITLKSKIFLPLPLDTSLSVADLLKNYYELAKPATRRGLSLALKYTDDKTVQEQLSAWLNDDTRFQTEINETQTSLFSLLEKSPSIQMPFPAFLSLLPPLSVRQYSISSSPLRDASACSITYGVLTDTTKDPHRPFYGVATTYLSTLQAGDRIQVATRRTAKPTFRLPLDAANMPMLMFAAGTGLAPFRGFIEQRAIQLEANADTNLAPAYLFLGCRHSERDRLYADAMDKWAAIGAVKVFYTFSQQPEKSDGCKYVADRMAKESDTISAAWAAGARAYTCGNRSFAQSVGKAAREIAESRVAARGAEDSWSVEEVEARKAAILGSFGERAADDVFD